jgi:hypothetical protein
MKDAEPEMDMHSMTGLRQNMRPYASEVLWDSPCQANEWCIDDCEPLLRSIRSSQFGGRAWDYAPPVSHVQMAEPPYVQHTLSGTTWPSVLLPVLPFISYCGAFEIGTNRISQDRSQERLNKDPSRTLKNRTSMRFGPRGS